MLTLIRSLLPAAFIALPMLYVPAAAGGQEIEDMNIYLCKDVMRMPSEDRSVTLGVLHGYVLGKKGATTFVVNDANKLSNDFVEFCLDNPKAKALESFEKLAK